MEGFIKTEGVLDIVDSVPPDTANIVLGEKERLEFTSVIVSEVDTNNSV